MDIVIYWKKLLTENKLENSFFLAQISLKLSYSSFIFLIQLYLKVNLNYSFISPQNIKTERIVKFSKKSSEITLLFMKNALQRMIFVSFLLQSHFFKNELDAHENGNQDATDLCLDHIYDVKSLSCCISRFPSKVPYFS